MLLEYINAKNTDMDPDLKRFADQHFPPRSKADLQSLPAAAFVDDQLLRNTPHRLARTARDKDAPTSWDAIPSTDTESSEEEPPESFTQSPPTSPKSISLVFQSELRGSARVSSVACVRSVHRQFVISTNQPIL